MHMSACEFNSSLELDCFFENAMGSADLLPLDRSGLTNRGNLNTQCWCSLVNILVEEGYYCIIILLIFIWVYPYFGYCCR